MKVVVVSQSLLAEEASGGARFLRGIIAELESRGDQVETLGFPGRSPAARAALDLDGCLDEADLILVDAGVGAALIGAIGAHRVRHGGYRLYLRDTRLARTAPEMVEKLDLAGYDGVLASSEDIRSIYLERDWAARAWLWHEAADTRVFRPLPEIEPEADLIWIGNWGRDARAIELRDLLLRPARSARLHGNLYGSDYPAAARLRIRLSGLQYRGRAADHRVPELFAGHRLTVHLPRGPALEVAPGDLAIGPFEALACGIPLVSTPWDDCEGLLRPEQDYLLARDCAEMREAMQAILEFPEFAAKLRDNGLEAIRTRHSCAHRVDELLAIDGELRGLAPLEVT